MHCINVRKGTGSVLDVNCELGWVAESSTDYR